MKRRFTVLFTIFLLGFGFVGGAIFIFQNNIARFLLNPRTPFQAVAEPTAPDYTNPAHWALLPDNSLDEGFADAASKVDIFYIYGSTAKGREYWNASFSDPEIAATLAERTIPNEIGLLHSLGTIYAPYYRQATLYSRFTHKFDGIAARTLAYNDIRQAFEHYLKSADSSRPLILVGYDQGGLYIQGLLSEYVANDQRLKDRLVAAYILDHGLPQSVFDNVLKSFRPCIAPQQTGCVISYTDFEQKFSDEINRFRSRALIIDEQQKIAPVVGDDMLCVNPLTWFRNEEFADASKHAGGASATGLKLGQRPPIISSAVGTQCDKGILRIEKPSKSFLRHKRWFGQQWHAAQFNLFYADLANDAERRLTLHIPVLKERYRQLDPIPFEEAVDLNDSPINKVPD